MSKKGIVITLEGSEGCGKSTQVKLLHRYFKKKGYSVFLTREPGGTRIGDGIRALLLDNKNHRLCALSEVFLYMASRAQIVDEVIFPKLKKGNIVLCDRWLDATVAYQGYGLGGDKNWIYQLGKTATQGAEAKLTLFLDVPHKCGLERVKKRRSLDRIENKGLAFHKRVYRGYKEMAKQSPQRFKVVKIDPQDSPARVHEKIIEMVRHVL